MSQINEIKRLADDPEISSEVIRSAGGPTLFAKIIGMDTKWKAQVVTNWRRKGFPRHAFLEYPSILALCEAAKKAGRRAA